MTITIVGGGNPSGPTFPVQRSVRLRASASASFTRTPASAGDRQKFTISFWLKRGTLGGADIFDGNNANGFIGSFRSDYTLYLYDLGAASGGFQIYSARVFRDPSAWYHIVIAVDTTQATDTNRIKVYINGVQENLATWTLGAGASRYPSLNANFDWNNTNQHKIGYAPSGNGYFDGYLTEFNNVSGFQLDATSFGAYNSYGVWSPAKYSGTYGNNGFYLNFQDNSAATATTIGKDSSGNGNNWTPNNISVTAGVTYDSMLDVPTLTSATNANFCTLNPLAASTSTVPAQGNLYLGTNGPNNFGCVATFGVSSGKWYWEVKPDSSYVGIGITSLSFLPANSWPGAAGSQAKAYYSINGQKYDNGTNSAYGATFSSADLIGVALDMDAGTITFYKNNVSQGVAFTSLTGIYLPVIGGPNTYNSGYINFGQRPFSYTPPTGFKSLNTYNLPAPTIPNGAAYMAATLYTGNGSTQSITNTVNGVSFQPDFVWIKSRSAVSNNAVLDSVRPSGYALYPNLTAVEGNNSTLFTGITSNGFNLAGTNATYNQAAATYVGWQWKANGTPATTIVGGTIPSVVSVNKTAGFSVVTYTGNGTGALASVGHGLGIPPKMIILKNRGSVTNWPVYHANLTSAAYVVFLNATNAQAADIGYWGNTPPDSGQFYIYGTSGSGTNISGANYVAYCWAEIPGFSKFGSYTGTGNTDGAFVYTGFRPRWIMTKQTGAVSNWSIHDTSRAPYNLTINELYADTSDVEYTGTNDSFDLLSNGFKPRSAGTPTNASGGTYIYVAFAENPFNYSLAR